MKTRLLLILALFSGSFAHAQNSELALKSNDRVTITIAGIPDNEIAQINKVYTISDSGTINLAHIREVRAVGMKPSSLQKAIEQAYVSQEIYTRPSVTVSIDGGDGATQRVVYVISGCMRNGPVPYNSGMSLMKAIGAAGGFTPFARPSKTNIIRNGQTMSVDLSKITKNPASDVKLQPEDQIIVPE